MHCLLLKEQCHSLFRQKGPILTNTYICIYFSNKDHSVGGMWPGNSIALDSMDFYWDVFVASFFSSLLCALFLFCCSVAVVFLYRRRVEAYQANLNVQHLLGLGSQYVLACQSILQNIFKLVFTGNFHEACFALSVTQRAMPLSFSSKRSNLDQHVHLYIFFE